MPKQIFKAIDAAGQTHTRSSLNRTYTHTVVFLPKIEADLARADHDQDLDGKNWEFACKMVAWGGVYGGERKSYQTDEAVAQSLALNKKAMDEFASREAAIAGRRADRIARIRKAEAEGYYQKWQNAGWAGRPDLAQKLAASIANKATVAILLAQAA